MTIYVNTVLVVIFTTCTALVIHPRYVDGLVGRIALGGMAVLCGVMFIVGNFTLQAVYLGTEALAFFGLVALFLLRHAYRFFRWCHACPLNTASYPNKHYRIFDR